MPGNFVLFGVKDVVLCLLTPSSNFGLDPEVGPELRLPE